MKKISFNIPYKLKNLKKFDNFKTYAGNGIWTKKIQNRLSKKYSFKKVLLTDSCTSALEIAALSLKLKSNDEVIIPSYAYPTTASSFLRCGYKIKFVDCNENDPKINKQHFIRQLNKKTKAVVIVHHAGQPEDLDFFLSLKKKYRFKLIEDAAQCIDLRIGKKYLGSFGDFGCISFHESKNIHCGLGGALIINNKKFNNLSHYIWERGTNRKDFDKNTVKKYTWTEIGSNFYPTEFQANYLYNQLANISFVQKKRKKIFQLYVDNLKSLIENKKVVGMNLNLKTNYHMYYILLQDFQEREKLKNYLEKKNIHTVSHYEPLHLSKIGKKFTKSKFKNTKNFSERILRLPIHTELSKKQILFICQSIKSFFEI